MNKKVLTLLVLPILALVIASCGTAPLPTSDNPSIQLTSYFDLRERESFLQVTNVVDESITVHVQVFNVNLDCTENNFYDTYTGNDTHVYNMNDIQTNDGTPSGINLADNAYGFVVVSIVAGPDLRIVTLEDQQFAIGNFRIVDNSGYEYRTNMSGYNTAEPWCFGLGSTLDFNFSQTGGATLSDVVGIAFENAGPGCNADEEGELIPCDPSEGLFTEVAATNFEAVNVIFDVDITDNAESVFSCRDVMFACINEDNPKYADLLSAVSDNVISNDISVNVAGLEYGINDAFPHSKGGPVLCPQNNITEGTVRLRVEDFFGEQPGNLDGDGALGILDGDEFFTGFVGLNNGNGRGSMDSIWFPGLGAIFELGQNGQLFPDACDFQVPPGLIPEPPV